MTNKSPYEIRSDAYTLAEKYVRDAWEANVNHIKFQYELGQKTANDMMKAMTPYTFDQIKEKAAEIYDFVQNK